MPNALPLSSGIGLKPQHYGDVLDAPKRARPGWVEVHPQNYFADGGPAHRWLGAIRSELSLSFHSVGLSLGSSDGCNVTQLERLADLCDRYQPASVSDHLSWSGNAHDQIPDLLPIAYTSASLNHFCEQISRVQDRLKQRILIENPSRMLSWRVDEMDEIAFFANLISKSGCGMLLDINNVIVSATNIGFCAADYVDAIPAEWIGEVHLAGHTTEFHDSGPLKIDDHGSPVGDECWELYARCIERVGPLPTLIEWDTDVPEFPALMRETDKADIVLAQVQFDRETPNARLA